MFLFIIGLIQLLLFSVAPRIVQQLLKLPAMLAVCGTNSKIHQERRKLHQNW